MIRKTHRDKSTSLLRREPAIPHFEVDIFLLLRSDLHNIILPLNLCISLKLGKLVWVKMSFAYDNDVHSLLSIP